MALKVAVVPAVPAATVPVVVNPVDASGQVLVADIAVWYLYLFVFFISYFILFYFLFWKYFFGKFVLNLNFMVFVKWNFHDWLKRGLSMNECWWKLGVGLFEVLKLVKEKVFQMIRSWLRIFLQMKLFK